MGNSDHSMPRSAKPATSLTAAAPLWHAFVRDVTAKLPVAKFVRPKGVVKAQIDAWSGGRPGPWTRATTTELFVSGTQPGAKRAVDPDGLLYARTCGGWRVDPLAAEVGPASWDLDVADWLRRARRGVGVLGPLDTRTAYFWGERSWGGPLVGTCQRPKPPRDDNKPPKHGHGGDGGGGGGGPLPSPTPPPP
jgi:hypothetical protein